jgi:predicted NAD/FAD-binding protein
MNYAPGKTREVAMVGAGAAGLKFAEILKQL